MNEQEDDFAAGRTVEASCGEKKPIIDWSKPTGDVALFQWVDERR